MGSLGLSLKPVDLKKFYGICFIKTVNIAQEVFKIGPLFFPNNSSISLENTWFGFYI